MMQNAFFGGDMFGWMNNGPWLFPLLPLLALWSIFWKGLGLWHSAGRRQGWWFIAILLINTMGILELVYLFGILKLKTSELFPAKKL